MIKIDKKYVKKHVLKVWNLNLFSKSIKYFSLLNQGEHREHRFKLHKLSEFILQFLDFQSFIFTALYRKAA